MLQVTARIMQGTSVYGYILTNGVLTQPLTKEQAWIYAKNKEILNVIPTGDSNNPGLSGINGFELKKLPDIPYEQSVKGKHVRYNAQDTAACAIREVLKTNKPIELSGKDRENWLKELFKRDTMNGTVNPEECRTLSEYFEVVDIFYDEDIKSGSLALGTTRELLRETSPIVGYGIKYTGTEPIHTQRMAIGQGGTLEPFTIMPNDYVALNRAETVILASDPRIGFTFSNGKIASFTKKVYRTVFDELKACYFAYNRQPDGSMISVHEVKIPLTSKLGSATIEKYFKIGNKPKATEEETQKLQKQQRETELTQKLKNARTMKDIFRALKR